MEASGGSANPPDQQTDNSKRNSKSKEPQHDQLESPTGPSLSETSTNPQPTISLGPHPTVASAGEEPIFRVTDKDPGEGSSKMSTITPNLPPSPDRVEINAFLASLSNQSPQPHPSPPLEESLRDNLHCNQRATCNNASVSKLLALATPKTAGSRRGKRQLSVSPTKPSPKRVLRIQRTPVAMATYQGVRQQSTSVHVACLEQSEGDAEREGKISTNVEEAEVASGGSQRAEEAEGESVFRHAEEVDIGSASPRAERVEVESASQRAEEFLANCSTMLHRPLSDNFRDISQEVSMASQANLGCPFGGCNASFTQAAGVRQHVINHLYTSRDEYLTQPRRNQLEEYLERTKRWLCTRCVRPYVQKLTCNCGNRFQGSAIFEAPGHPVPTPNHTLTEITQATIITADGNTAYDNYDPLANDPDFFLTLRTTQSPTIAHIPYRCRAAFAREYFSLIDQVVKDHTNITHWARMAMYPKCVLLVRSEALT